MYNTSICELNMTLICAYAHSHITYVYVCCRVDLFDVLIKFIHSAQIQIDYNLKINKQTAFNVFFYSCRLKNKNNEHYESWNIKTATVDNNNYGFGMDVFFYHNR